MTAQNCFPQPNTAEDAHSALAPSIVTRYRVALVREPAPEYEHPQPCNRPSEVAAFVRQLLADWDREVVGAVLVNHDRSAIGHVIAYIGTRARTLVEARGLLVPALLAKAAGIILFHNHPDGGTQPSREDIEFCRRLAKAGELVEVDLVDSLIVTPEGPWASMWQLGLIPPPSASKGHPSACT